MDWLKNLWNYVFEKVNITITPSPKYRVRVFAMRRIIPILIFIIIGGTIGTFGILYKYYHNNYLTVSSKLNNLQGVEAENQCLKNELLVLAQDTEVLKQTLYELQDYNREIKAMINLSQNDKQKREEKLDFKLQTLFICNQNIPQQGLPIGGGDFHLYYQNPEDLLKQMKSNIEIIKKELPVQHNDLDALKNSVKKYNALKAATPNIWPVADKGKGFISSNFGWRTHPITNKQEFHEGLDIGVWYNTPVLATADGKIKYAGWINGYGWIVKIDHGFGFETRYGHLNKLKVKKGTRVTRGQVIALSGNSGRSTGPHLHYEVRKNNIPQNPRKYIGG